ncbi:sugar transferase [Paenibacillus sp.]|uniref:sugar transferase n=1 Tax=Paenibacillus sp. TaxID=58172 RepID=UPI002D2F63A7|nr:sugar transferase [Paenibacillus sp.]HZG86170.1 sugar transferase [Paenibacillus sp.]
MQTQVDFSLLESLARSKKRSAALLSIINVVLTCIEFILYAGGFYWLYYWRVIAQFPNGPQELFFLAEYLFLFVVIHVCFIALLIDKGIFRLERQRSLIDELFLIIKSAFLSYMFAIGLMFILQTSVVYSRLHLLIYFFIMIFIATVFRSAKALILAKLSKNERYVRNVLIVGAGRIGEQVKAFLLGRKNMGYNLVGMLDDHKEGDCIIGTLDDLEQQLWDRGVHEVYITIPSEKKVIHDLLMRIRKYDVQIKVIPEMYDYLPGTVNYEKNDAFPYMEFYKSPLRGMKFYGKRLFDIIVSLIGIILCLPVFSVIALLIKLDSKGPVIFKQKRIGQHGVPFQMYKFRSMVVDAEELKAKLVSQNEADGPVFKIKSDPRVTRVGHFIRKYSLDELPQLFNVLFGSMSLIGPRPPLPQEVEQYSDHQWRRLDLLPGITGLWQVSGRSDLSFEEWVSLDIYYIQHWSFGLDLKILLRTVPVVLFSKGAY